MRSVITLAQRWPLDIDALEAVSRVYPFRADAYYAGLIRFPEDPIWKQMMPDERELSDSMGWEDPLAEESLSPVPNLVHRYPNRVLWLVSEECAVHCRFCTRKRRWAKPVPMTEEDSQAALDYIRQHHEVKDVLLSGGDPLLLPAARLEFILASLRQIPHVEIIRIGTRVPCTLPQRITTGLAAMLARYYPLYMNLHFNHPWEITVEARQACIALANAGIPLGSQTVLLRGVNDRAEILGELFQKLLTLRVRPYYLMQMDLTQGTSHFRTPLSTGLSIISALRNRISGLAMPHFVIDLPHGRGKIPLIANNVEEIADKRLIVKDYRGGRCEYPLLEGESDELRQWLRQPL